jgi:hypothetical protein
MAETLRERSVGELIEQSLSLTFKNFVKLFAIQLVFYLIVLGLAIPFGLALVGAAASQSTALLGFVGGIMVLALLFLGPLPNAATIVAISDSFTDRDHSIIDCYQAAFPFLVRLLLLGLAIGILAILGILIIIGPILVLLIYFVSTPAMLLEDLNVGQAMGRSSELTRGNRWRLLGLVICVAIISGALSMVSQLITGGIQASAPGLGMVIVALIINQLVSTVGGLIVTCAQVASYFDLRVRKDAYHLDQLAEVVDRIAPSSTEAS